MVALVGAALLLWWGSVVGPCPDTWQTATAGIPNLRLRHVQEGRDHPHGVPALELVALAAEQDPQLHRRLPAHRRAPEPQPPEQGVLELSP